jgi:nucleotide-binding universal stress UspA family protein
MFDKILFATSASPASDHAAHVAFDLAKKYDSEMKVFHVYGLPSRGFSTEVKDLRTGEVEEANADYVNWVIDEMKNTYDKYLKDCSKCTLDTTAGVPHTEILRTARKFEADLIVMGAHTREEDVGATRYRNIVGSTMQKVAQKARCPVLIVSRPCTTCFWYFSNIIFCADFSRQADSAFQFALSVSKAIGCKIYLFHCLDLSAMSAGKVLSQEEIEEKIEAAGEKIQKRYVSKMGDFDNYEVDVWEGIPYVEIVKYSRKNNGDLIIMAHHTREMDPEKALLGSTVEQVVLRASCPVASVNRPDHAEVEAEPEPEADAA